MFKIQVTEQEYQAAEIGGEWWQQVPDEDQSSVYIVTAIHTKLQQDGKFYIVSGAFLHGPKFLRGTSGIREKSPQEMALEAGT